MLVYLFVGIAGADRGFFFATALVWRFRITGDAFPFATASANLLGSFLITLFMAYFSGKKRLSANFEIGTLCRLFWIVYDVFHI